MLEASCGQHKTSGDERFDQRFVPVFLAAVLHEQHVVCFDLFGSPFRDLFSGDNGNRAMP